MKKLLTQVFNWGYENYCPMVAVFSEDEDGGLVLQWDEDVYKVLQDQENVYGHQIEHMFHGIVSYHQTDLFGKIESLLSEGEKLPQDEVTLAKVNHLLKEYFDGSGFWSDVEQLLRKNEENLLKIED